MALNALMNTSLQFILFGGKGGVGKTTMAVATALELAREQKVLLFGGEILDILQQGTYLADEETEEILHLDIPGLDEVMSLKKIIDFMENADYQLYIVDTAPTGHTLRLLMVPELLDNWIKFLAGLRWKHHMMIRQFTREDRLEQADTFLLEMKKTVKKVRALLLPAEKTEFVIVTIAEKMAVSETEDLISNLQQMHIPSRHLIINNIFPLEASGFAATRREIQARYIHEMQEKFSAYTITEVVLQPTEMQGIANLQALGTQLFLPQ
jgi:arsenite/tail-anchored protein-transporting ATPase